MNEILKWLGEYSLAVVILIVIGGAFLFVFQRVVTGKNGGARSEDLTSRNLL